MARLKQLLKAVLSPALELAERARYGRHYTNRHNNLDPETHLREAGQWIVRAQDSGLDRGVAYGTRFGQGFLASYPETTGYIIPTMFRLAEHWNEPALIGRAIEMGDWEISIQLPSGAVRGGMYQPEDSSPTPAVFNTGQVLLGWAALLRHTGESRYRQAGQRASDWLVGIQEANGTWIQGNSRFANPSFTLYNVKAAWGLCLFGLVCGNDDYVRAAVRNAEFTQSKQQSNGWFPDCCLTDSTRPLLHTIAYTMQALVEIGMLVGRQDLIEAGARPAAALRQRMSPEGFLAGRFDHDWNAAAGWCCLTGSAQTSIVWQHLANLGVDAGYRDAARTLNRYLMARHDIASPDPAIRGGVAGSWPVWGEYGRFQILNWATKFFLDALLMDCPRSR